MNATYTRKQAMERLGVRSTNAFIQMTKKYPEAFVIIPQATIKYPRYDKDALDSFAMMRDSLQDQFRFA